MIRYAEPEDDEAVRAALGDRAAGATVLLVAEVQDSLAGLAALGPAQNEGSPSTGEVIGPAVVPVARPDGDDEVGRRHDHDVAMRLLDAAAEELRWAGFDHAVAWVVEDDGPARRRFEEAGWAFDGGERPELRDGVAQRLVRYRRGLPSSPYALRFDTATPDDVDDLLRLSDDLAQWLLDRGIEQWRPGELPAGRIRHFVVDGDVTVLRSGEELVGAVTVTWQDPFAWEDSVGVAGYVHQLMIARSLAGQGLGRRLLQRAERRIADAGLRRVRLDCVRTNQALRRYYERAGYRYVRDSDYGGRTDLLPAALYEKRLTAPPTATP